jgi:hypothetical protein
VIIAAADVVVVVEIPNAWWEAVQDRCSSENSENHCSGDRLAGVVDKSKVVGSVVDLWDFVAVVQLGLAQNAGLSSDTGTAVLHEQDDQSAQSVAAA